MNIDKIVAEMPKAENPHSPDESLWDRATKAQRRLLAEQGWRKVPSEEELHEKILEVLIGIDSAEEGVKNMRMFLLEKELEGDSTGA